MKKIIAALLTVLILMTAAFAYAETNGLMLGGWSVAESTELTEEQTALFEAATEGLIGVNYEPVAYLGSQIVSGTNHCFLCKAQVVAPNTTPYLTLVYIYENLEGELEILNIAGLDLGELATPAIVEE